jgi:hypothetical protein
MKRKASVPVWEYIDAWARDSQPVEVEKESGSVNGRSVVQTPKVSDGYSSGIVVGVALCFH